RGDGSSAAFGNVVGVCRTSDGLEWARGSSFDEGEVKAGSRGCQALFFNTNRRRIDRDAQPVRVRAEHPCVIAMQKHAISRFVAEREVLAELVAEHVVGVADVEGGDPGGGGA